MSCRSLASFRRFILCYWRFLHILEMTEARGGGLAPSESMTHIELIGPPGAGKSTLQDHLTVNESIAGNNELNRRLVRNTPVLNKLSRAVESDRIDWMFGEVYWRIYFKRLLLKKFRHTYSDLYKVCQNAGDLDDRWFYPKMYFNAGAQFIYFRDYVDDPFLIDEGFPQLAPEVLSLSQDLGNQYLQLLPVPDLIISLDCPAEEAYQRQVERSKSMASSLADRDPEAVIDKIEQYRTQFDTTTTQLSQRGAEILSINTADSSLDCTFATVEKKLQNFDKCP